ncbi:hypothetical protein BWI93_09330 [Siphonobacter sp. BAB-5385]|uniref:DUF3667 domain-containing protein n=2 Tax=unclassified Siphonobacter TaxID=2635712 RepID=UPI000B9E76B0|nr:DUF3667 domain-containing protein [Siphonobacter sp. BAB-5385]OZI08388.1 hypothetical protein BWI93_09330 [Siphonobacter sp. BAB-5385]
MNCKNCNTEINSNYCPGCGQPAKLKRIDGHYIVHEIEHVLHFERGILYTIRELLTHPGQNVRNYISDNRSRLVKPIIFIIITSLIYTIVSHFFHIENSYIQYNEITKTTVSVVFKWIQDHYGYSNIIMGVFIAGWLKVFFRKYDYNFFEILILLCFVIGMSMLIYTLFAIFQGVTGFRLMQIGGMISIVYNTWAIGQFFDKKKVGSYIKALASYLLGMITFMLTGVFMGIAIDTLMR